jgi:hypothetical protein
MKRQIALLLAGLTGMAVSLMPVDTARAAYQQSGISGQVFLYTCAVVYPGAVCYEPYQASINVVTQAGRFITRFTTDQEGRFQIFLRPGTYVLVSSRAQQTLPFLKPVTVRVEPRTFTPVTIVYDSGIR